VRQRRSSAGPAGPREGGIAVSDKTCGCEGVGHKGRNFPGQKPTIAAKPRRHPFRRAFNAGAGSPAGPWPTWVGGGCGTGVRLGRAVAAPVRRRRNAGVRWAATWSSALRHHRARKVAAWGTLPRNDVGVATPSGARSERGVRRGHRGGRDCLPEGLG